MPNATYYKKLGQAVDEILAELKRNSISAQHWAVNWGDLHCTQIEERKVVYPEREDKTIVILIEEADPFINFALIPSERKIYNKCTSGQTSTRRRGWKSSGYGK